MPIHWIALPTSSVPREGMLRMKTASRITNPEITVSLHLAIKAPITTAVNKIQNSFHCFSEKIRLDISCESSARQRIHVKHQALSKGIRLSISYCLVNTLD